MIYLDQAATSFPKIKEVQDAVIDCMNHCTNANRSTSTTTPHTPATLLNTKKIPFNANLLKNIFMYLKMDAWS